MSQHPLSFSGHQVQRHSFIPNPLTNQEGGTYYLHLWRRKWSLRDVRKLPSLKKTMTHVISPQQRRNNSHDMSSGSMAQDAASSTAKRPAPGPPMLLTICILPPEWPVPLLILQTAFLRLVDESNQEDRSHRIAQHVSQGCQSPKQSTSTQPRVV